MTSVILLTIQAALIQYVTDWMSTIERCASHDARLRDAIGYIDILIEESEKHGVDPFLGAIVISYESSWKTSARGKAGDTGLMQVMPRYFRNRFDLTTPRGQIAAGVSHLRVSLDACNGDVAQALNYYKMNKCTPIVRSIKWRANRYREIKRKYGRINAKLLRSERN